MTICPWFLTSLLADWALLVPPSLTCLVDLLSLFSTLSKAHLGYLHLVRAFLRWSFSCWSNSVAYGVAKELAKILKPLVDKSPPHITSTQDFVEQAKQIILEPGECLSSYEVSALFTSVPIDPALTIIKGLLEKDTTLKEGTVMEVSDIILLLEFCLKNT